MVVSELASAGCQRGVEPYKDVHEAETPNYFDADILYPVMMI